MMTRNSDNGTTPEKEERHEEDALPIAHAEDSTLRQETIGAVGAVGASGVVGAVLPGNGAYVGGATLLGLATPFGRGRDSDGLV